MGVGTADSIRVGLYDVVNGTTGAAAALHEISMKFLGVQQGDRIELPVVRLRKPGYVLEYASMHRTVIEHHLQLIGDSFETTVIREWSVCASKTASVGSSIT
jgi:hypothetical protein